MQREFLQRIDITAVAAFTGVVYLVLALRTVQGPRLARYAIAASAFLIAALVVLRDLAPIVAYSILCFSLTMVYLADMLQDERARRRRVALLAPRPAADRVPTIWIAITLLSALALVPYAFGGVEVAAALIATGCALAMAGVAWRIASAPTQLSGEDPQSENRCERASRARRTGLTCVVAIGSVALFVGFVNATPPAFGGLGRVTDIELLLVWAALWIWQVWYVRRVSQTARTAS